MSEPLADPFGASYGSLVKQASLQNHAKLSASDVRGSMKAINTPKSMEQRLLKELIAMPTFGHGKAGHEEAKDVVETHATQSELGDLGRHPTATLPQMERTAQHLFESGKKQAESLFAHKESPVAHGGMLSMLKQRPKTLAPLQTLADTPTAAGMPSRSPKVSNTDHNQKEARQLVPIVTANPTQLPKLPKRVDDGSHNQSTETRLSQTAVIPEIPSNMPADGDNKDLNLGDPLDVSDRKRGSAAATRLPPMASQVQYTSKSANSTKEDKLTISGTELASKPVNEDEAAAATVILPVGATPEKAAKSKKFRPQDGNHASNASHENTELDGLMAVSNLVSPVRPAQEKHHQQDVLTHQPSTRTHSSISAASRTSSPNRSKSELRHRAIRPMLPKKAAESVGIEAASVKTLDSKSNLSHPVDDEEDVLVDQALAKKSQQLEREESTASDAPEHTMSDGLEVEQLPLAETSQDGAPDSQPAPPPDPLKIKAIKEAKLRKFHAFVKTVPNAKRNEEPIFESLGLEELEKIFIKDFAFLEKRENDMISNEINAKRIHNTVQLIYIPPLQWETLSEIIFDFFRYNKALENPVINAEQTQAILALMKQSPPITSGQIKAILSKDAPKNTLHLKMTFKQLRRLCHAASENSPEPLYRPFAGLFAPVVFTLPPQMGAYVKGLWQDYDYHKEQHPQQPDEHPHNHHLHLRHLKDSKRYHGGSKPHLDTHNSVGFRDTSHDSTNFRPPAIGVAAVSPLSPFYKSQMSLEGEMQRQEWRRKDEARSVFESTRTLNSSARNVKSEERSKWVVLKQALANLGAAKLGAIMRKSNYISENAVGHAQSEVVLRVVASADQVDSESRDHDLKPIWFVSSAFVAKDELGRRIFLEQDCGTAAAVALELMLRDLDDILGL
ncbi:hypothetical protein BJ741DRAFT_607150 [Chytriomyces cf. hyalinus JEL632]|nr:hypothetical protein BJ741DRAFT_607150 [Chytriomyces cf. hyalinus JEL632]